MDSHTDKVITCPECGNKDGYLKWNDVQQKIYHCVNCNKDYLIPHTFEEIDNFNG